jgi:hypothetical protein
MALKRTDHHGRGLGDLAHVFILLHDAFNARLVA